MYQLGWGNPKSVVLCIVTACECVRYFLILQKEDSFVRDEGTLICEYKNGHLDAVGKYTGLGNNVHLMHCYCVMIKLKVQCMC